MINDEIITQQKGTTETNFTTVICLRTLIATHSKLSPGEVKGSFFDHSAVDRLLPLIQ